MNALFGDSGDSSSSGAADSTPYSFLSAIYGTGSSTASASDTATPSTAALSTYEQSLQLEQAQSLFGTDSSGGSSSSFFG